MSEGKESRSGPTPKLPPIKTPFQAQIKKLVLDGSDEIAMDGSSSALEPHQVSRITCGFAGPTSGTVARCHSSLD